MASALCHPRCPASISKHLSTLTSVATAGASFPATVALPAFGTGVLIVDFAQPDSTISKERVKTFAERFARGYVLAIADDQENTKDQLKSVQLALLESSSVTRFICVADEAAAVEFVAGIWHASCGTRGGSKGPFPTAAATTAELQDAGTTDEQIVAAVGSVLKGNTHQRNMAATTLLSRVRSLKDLILESQQVMLNGTYQDANNNDGDLSRLEEFAAFLNTESDPAGHQAAATFK